MADERTPGEPDPDDDRTPDAGSEGYRLGGSGQGPSGGSGSSGSGSAGFGGGPAGGQGNPFEAFMNQFGGGDMNQLMSHLQNAFAMLGGGGSLFGQPTTAGDSGVNWEVTKDTARKTVASLGADPSPGFGQQHEITEATSIAETWLDAATDFPRVSTVVAAWSRAEWIENTMPVWKRLVEPVASHIADAMEGALKFGDDSDQSAAIPGLAGMEQMLRPMLRTSGASMFGLQLGQGLGQLAAEVVGATDIGLPLSEPGHVALLPTNIAKFGEGLEQSTTDVTLYLALRESARQRLFAAAGWLREQMLTLVEEYARGITIDTSALEEAVGRIDPENLAELSQQLEGGLFEPHKTPEQLATLERLETMLALVEGWVDDVVTQATAPWMPSAGALAETVRRQRATGGPAEATFATLVGLELRPRRLRDAANLWAALRDARGADGRDAVWSHPDLLPTSADLDDPIGYVQRGTDAGVSDEDFDAALAKLLDAADEESGTGEKSGENEDPEDGSAAERRAMELRPDYPVLTDRLTLRPFTADDIDAMLAYRGRSDVCRYLPFEPQDRAALLDRFESGVLSRTRLTSEGQALTLGAWRRDTGELAGDVILFFHSEEHAGGEIGWVFDPAHSGRGLATEAASAILQLAFGELGLHRVTARLDPRNDRSVALCERLGMRREAHFVSCEVFKGEWADLAIYAVLADEWRAAQGSSSALSPNSCHR